MNTHTRFGRLDQHGFTLIELVIVIVTLGIIAAIAIPRFGEITESSKVNATRSEMIAIKKAIIGNPQAVAGGEYIDRGFEGDVGFTPNQLVDLVRKPDSIASYDKFTRLGWNGPYLDSAQELYRTDAWGVNYVYQPLNRRIVSVGGPDSIIVNF